MNACLILRAAIISGLASAAVSAQAGNLTNPAFFDGLTTSVEPSDLPRQAGLPQSGAIFVEDDAQLSGSQNRPAKRALPVNFGCDARQLNTSGLTGFLGPQSRCLGGRLSQDEQSILALDYPTGVESPALMAMRDDPRFHRDVPVSASMGVALPIGKRTHLGMEYSFSQRSQVDPYGFSGLGKPADEVSGHSALLRLGLSL